MVADVAAQEEVKEKCCWEDLKIEGLIRELLLPNLDFKCSTRGLGKGWCSEDYQVDQCASHCSSPERFLWILSQLKL